jgi:hypothetical protein
LFFHAMMPHKKCEAQQLTHTKYAVGYQSLNIKCNAPFVFRDIEFSFKQTFGKVKAEPMADEAGAKECMPASASSKRKNASSDVLVRKRCRLDDGNRKSKSPMAGIMSRTVQRQKKKQQPKGRPNGVAVVKKKRRNAEKIPEEGSGGDEGRTGGVGVGNGERCHSEATMASATKNYSRGKMIDLLLSAAEKESGVAAEAVSNADLVDGKKQESQSGVAIIRSKSVLNTHFAKKATFVSPQPFLPGKKMARIIEGGDDDRKEGGSEGQNSRSFAAVEAGNVNVSFS